MNAAASGSFEAADPVPAQPSTEPRSEFGCSGKAWLEAIISVASLARGVIGNTPVFGTGVPSSSLGGPAFFRCRCTGQGKHSTAYGTDPSDVIENQYDPTRSTGERPVAAILLAAGKGTRMDSDLPKVVLEVAGQPMIRWVVKAVRELSACPIVLVVGHRGELVRELFQGDDDDLLYVTQEPQLGTGHAVGCAKDVLHDFDGDVFVLAGDGPLIQTATLQRLLDRQRQCTAAATLATSTLDDPTGYGRIIRDAQGKFDAIVEHTDANEQQRSIHEVYPSYACFDAGLLFDALDKLKPNQSTGEYYLTDAPALLLADNCKVELVNGVPAEDVLSINTPQQLSEVDSILSSRLQVQEKA